MLNKEIRLSTSYTLILLVSSGTHKKN